MKGQNNMNVILHGEAMIFPSTLPEGVEEMNPTNKEYHIIADSETTGNHHVIDVTENTKFYRKGDTMYMVNKKPTKVRCVLKDRHSPIDISSGTWEFGIQKEYDHFAQNMRNVRD